jgi:hypothetical protein
MLRHITLFFFFALLASSLCAQTKVIIVVKDMQGERLAYPEISIGDALHRMGSEQGTLEILPQAIRRNDTLTVRYLGYKPSKLLLDSLVLSKSLITVNLEEETYQLAPVTIVSNAFSSEAYFQQRLKSTLRPYTHKYFFDLLFAYQKRGARRNYLQGKSCRTFTSRAHSARFHQLRMFGYDGGNRKVSYAINAHNGGKPPHSECVL